MTSKNSFFKLAIENSKQRLWNIAVSILCLFFVLPIFSALKIGRWNERLASSATTFNDMISSFQKQIIGPVNSGLLAVTVILAVLLAFGGFQYLFSKSKTDLYHSMPLKRNTLFFITYINGILYFVIPYFVCVLITLLIGAGSHLLTSATIAVALTTFLLTLLGFIMLYTTIVLAITMTGNAIVAFLASGVFLLYGPALKTLLLGYQSSFFQTFYGGKTGTIYYSPVTLYANLLGDTRNDIHNYLSTFPLNLGKTIVLTIILLLLSIFLYNKRPSEAAGRSLSFEKTKPFIKILLMIPLTLGSGLFFRGITETGYQSSTSDTWLVFGVIIGLLLSHALIEIIYQFDFKAAFHRLYHILISGVIVVVIVCIFRFDLIGYDHYLPAAESVESIALSSYNLHDFVNYYDFEKTAPDSSSYYVDTEEYRMAHMNLPYSDDALKLVQTGIEDTLRIYNDSSITADDNIAEVLISYKLKNGAARYRRYSINLSEHLDLFDSIYSTEEYKKAVFPILTMDDSEIVNYQCASALGYIRLNTLMTDEEVKELIHIYQKELLAQTGYELSEYSPIGTISSTKEVPDLYSARTQTYECNQGLIYESFTETIAYLKAHGLDLTSYLDASNVQGVSVEYYSYEDDKETFANENYTDPKQFEQLVPILIPSDYYYTDYALRNKDHSFDVTVTYKSVPKGLSNVGTFLFNSDKLPDFIKKDFPDAN